MPPGNSTMPPENWLMPPVLGALFLGSGMSFTGKLGMFTGFTQTVYQGTQICLPGNRTFVIEERVCHLEELEISKRWKMALPLNEPS